VTNTDALVRRIDQTINQIGWAVIMVVPPEDNPDTLVPYAYTVGLTARGFPELLISGLNPYLCHKLLNDLAKRVYGTGRRFTHLEIIDDLIENLDAAIVVGQPTAVLHPSVALARYGAGRVRLQHVAWPDPHGRFPWQPDNTIAAQAQPLLTCRL
jgi:hypothetical protein